MTTVLMEDVGLGMGRLLKARPDLVASERSPIRTVIFAGIALAGVVWSVITYSNPEAAIASVAGTRREFYAIIGMFATPPAVVALGIVGIVWWSRRWRIPGGGKLRTAYENGFTTANPVHVLEVLASASSASDPKLLEVMRSIQHDSVMPSAYQFFAHHSPEDRLLVVAVTRSVLKNPDDAMSGRRAQLELEPLVRRGDAYIDLESTIRAVL